MSLWQWFLQKLRGTPPARDIARIHVGNDPEPTAEIVDVTGGPLKPGHLRRALRDGRLLPKPKGFRRRRPGMPRELLFPAHQARRLFSASLRTGNRTIRDLLADEEQLKRLGLPVWKTEHDLAEALNLSLRQLWFYAAHRQREKFPHYIMFAIPKRSGGERIILAPKRRLKALQRKLVELLIKHLPLSDSAHGFRTGRSIRTGAEPHVGHRLVLRIDLADFFETVTWERVRGLFIAYGYGYSVATTLALLTTEAERQPVELDRQMFYVPVGRRYCVQGAPTSPGICNAIVQRLDHRLEGLAEKFRCVYTRYADDLTFSGNLDRGELAGLMILARTIVQEEGFRVNEKKTRTQGRGGRQSVTGVVVNEVLGLSRQERRELRAAIHHLVTGRSQDANLRAWVEGRLAYVAMLNPDQAAVLRRKWQS